MSYVAIARKRQQQIHNKILELKNEIKEVSENEELFNDEVLSGFQVKTHKHTYYVSKCMLATKSEVFKTMFRCGTKEAKENHLVLDEDSKAVESILRFIYTRKKVDDVSLAAKVFVLAHRYEIKLLQLQCELFIMENMTIEDVEDCQRVSKKLDLRYLELKCAEILFFNFSEYDTKIDVDKSTLCTVTNDNVEPIMVTVDFEDNDKQLPQLELCGQKSLP
ncbi:unnamed protein product [Bursaphelenchus okinawaensis]|uniref:BTB domain-containing protein n=1 Tax=Bursaphelenchus okinawaensis TaxID=465554 RepID=A0A811JQ62_9BILA|nr:unnamed protein product [Bursaphelenchus okinawaensis]CAG9077722.1 unnamed protein product [Bursaphelenchus okinawaensis]